MPVHSRGDKKETNHHDEMEVDYAENEGSSSEDEDTESSSVSEDGDSSGARPSWAGDAGSLVPGARQAAVITPGGASCCERGAGRWGRGGDWLGLCHPELRDAAGSSSGSRWAGCPQALGTRGDSVHCGTRPRVTWQYPGATDSGVECPAGWSGRLEVSLNSPLTSLLVVPATLVSVWRAEDRQICLGPWRACNSLILAGQPVTSTVIRGLTWELSGS